jgi:non-specific serine/threonine protein kinase
MASVIHLLSDVPEPTNLPLQLTSFVGREAEIDELKRLLSRARLVTLMGAGGIGKTRLALEVASQLVSAFADGVWLVELAGLMDPALVPQAVLASLGFLGEPGRTPTEALTSFLGPRDAVCVLDSCEHLVEAVARLTGSLLTSCPRLRILATSREVLGVGGEVTFPVPSMTTPGVDRVSSVDDMLGYETVRLFAERAEAARPGFRVMDDNARSVAQICRRLDGIPLAIELAAARTRSMSVTAIEERISHELRLLTGGSRLSMPRQQTLQATFDWSHSLLNDEEKRIFRRLSVFVGGFRLEAAEALCGVNVTEGADGSVLDGLSSLVDKSLVISQAVGQPGRYRLLGPLRQYAYERLSEANEADNALRGHARYFLALGEEVARELLGPRQIAWMARVEEELDNFRASFGWALSHDPSAALRIAVALHRYWDENSPTEGGDWVERALEVYTPRDELRARALYDASGWARYRGYLDQARKLGQDSLELGVELANERCIGEALGVLAVLEDMDRGEEWLAHSLSLFQQAEAHLRTSNDSAPLSRLLNNYGFTLFAGRQLDAARSKIEEALALARARGDTWMLCPTLESLACVEFESGEVAAAGGHWRQALDLAGELRSRYTAASALVGIARLEMVQERPERFLRLFGAASSLLKLAGVVDADLAQIIDEAQLTSRALIGNASSDALFREGASMSFVQAIRFGLDEAIERAPSAPTTPASETGVSFGSQNAFAREGEFWSLSYDGVVARLRDSKGLRDIARLLAAPGREAAAVDLAAGELIEIVRPAARVGELGLGVEGNAGEVLDAEARAAYRLRLSDLEEEIAEADADNDPERASRGREEREFLLAELGAAVGLGGRARKTLDPAERARKAVTGRIRDAINHIEATHPELGRHLRRSIRTGSFCVYDPPEPTNWLL